jgi:hypothetical protein
MRIAISSGHSKYCRGASDIIDEVDEARKIVNRVVELLNAAGVSVEVFHDNVSTTQSENLDRIVDWHNSQIRDRDVSVHLNAYEHTSKPMGTECLYVTQSELAADVAAEIAISTGLIDRGPKYRSDLAFLNGTDKPAVLIQTLFCDSQADVDIYHQYFEDMCRAIAETIGDVTIGVAPPERPPIMPPAEGALLHVVGTCSWFGGPEDDGVSSDEGLAFLYELEDAPHLFLPQQPAGTTGLARRLDRVFYVACRWDYEQTPKDMLRDQTRKALVRAYGKEFLAYPADWGPHESTGRVADLSPALMEALGLSTDDEVEVIYPAP